MSFICADLHVQDLAPHSSPSVASRLLYEVFKFYDDTGSTFHHPHGDLRCEPVIGDLRKGSKSGYLVFQAVHTVRPPGCGHRWSGPPAADCTPQSSVPGPLASRPPYRTWPYSIVGHMRASLADRKHLKHTHSCLLCRSAPGSREVGSWPAEAPARLHRVAESS